MGGRSRTAIAVNNQGPYESMKREPQDTATMTTFTLDPEAGPSGTECGCRRDYCLSGSVATFGWSSWPEPVWQRNFGGRQAPGERPEFAGGLPVVDDVRHDGAIGTASCLEDSGRSDVLTALNVRGCGGVQLRQSALLRGLA
ncbi:hypothetical protein [Streptomyces mirabilis]|uniref:hypothetical protein n=1 Tax=Streptomyces mirabilis TaxID=68239 RepID=UPI0036EEB4E7